MYRQYTTTIVLCLFLATLVSGCASNSGRSYTSEEARRAQSVQTGTIVSLTEATIEEDPSGLGSVAGGVVGGVAGSTIGGGKGRVLGALGGAVVGAVAGALGEKALRTQKAYEFTIKLDSGQTLSVVQAVDDNYAVGDKVRILTGEGGKVRVVRLP